MRTVYIPEDQSFWEDHFLDQSGYGLPGFVGLPYQRGYGIGSFFRGLFRMAVPVLKKVAKIVGKQALAAGANIAGDVLRGQDFKESLKTHGREAAGTALEETGTLIRTGDEPVAQDGTGLGSRSKRRTTVAASSIKDGVKPKKTRRSRRAKSPSLPAYDVFTRQELAGQH